MSEKTVRIIAVGDIFLGEHPVTLGHGVTTVGREKGCDFLFDKVSHILKDGDIVCGNLEGIISPKHKHETGIKSAIFWGDPVCAETLKKSGFNCIFLANNHTVQHGKDAIERTCTLLDNHNIKWTGYNPDDPDTPLPAVFNVNGLKIGFLAYCETQQYHLDTQLLPLIKLEKIASDIEKLKTQCDVVIISLHWGDEFINYPSPAQVELAHEIIDAGANIIIGHHSHTMQGIERYNNGLIAYSLGSFIKDLWPKKLRESAILILQVSPNEIKDFSLTPILIHKKNHRPELLQGSAGDDYLAGIQRLSTSIEDRLSENANSLEEKYLKDVKRLLLRDRIGTIFHYLSNIFRYDKKLLYENIKLMIKRRVTRKNI